jgi:hypothetical protein
MVLKATVTHFEDQDAHKVFITNVDNDGTKWQLKKRYSQFETFYKAIKPDVGGVIFPGNVCSRVLYSSKLRFKLQAKVVFLGHLTR